MVPVAEERRHGGRFRFENGSSVSPSSGSPTDDVIPTAEPALGGAEAHRRQRWVWAAYTLLGLLLVTYFISLLVRSPDQQWAWLDGWSVAAFEFVASVICIYKGLARRPGRAMPLILGFSLLSWSLGDIVLTAESIGGAKPPTPSIYCSTPWPTSRP